MSVADPAPSGGISASCEQKEEAGYLGPLNQRVYYLLHPSEQPPVASVVLAGPFASERPHRYHAWTKWARWLAQSGFAALRFDYRGVGESSGRFEDMNFDSWRDDIDTCVLWLSERYPGTPVFIHGLGLGALLGTRSYLSGVGNGLLRWLAPVSGQEMLYEQLRLKISVDFSLGGSERKTRDDYVNDLVSGREVEVEGYRWTPSLWQSASEYSSELPTENNVDMRPVFDPALDKLAQHAFSGTGPNPLRAPGAKSSMRLLNPDLTNTFIENTEWLRKAAQ